MKTIKNIVLLGVVSTVALLSCNDDKIEPVDIEDPVLQRQSSTPVIGTVNLTYQEVFETSYEGLVKFIVHLEGEGDLTDLGHSILELNHRRNINVIKCGEYFSGGTLTISDDSEDKLKGDYGTEIFKTGDRYSINTTIKGGTGKYKYAYGNIRIFLNPDADDTYRAVIKGKIYGIHVHDPSK